MKQNNHLWLVLLLACISLYNTSLAQTEKRETVTFPKLKKDVDIFIWAGQSNAQGWQGDGLYYPEDTFQLDDSIGLYYTFVNTSNSAGNWIAMQAQTGRFPKGHFGSEVSFSRKLKQAGYNPVIFKHTIGATSIYNDWKKPGQNGIYDCMVKEFKKALDSLTKNGYNVNVRGFIWIQGESDAENDVMANAYYSNLQAIVRDVRSNLVKNNSLPIILGVDEQHQWVQQRPIIVHTHQRVAQEEQNAFFTSMYGLPKADATHLTPAGLVLHGERIFDEYIKLLTTIKIKSASWIKLNDESNAIYYSAGWNSRTQTDYFDGTCYSSSTVNSAATFFFNGTQGRFYGAKNINCGLADIYVDNIFQTTIDTYNPVLQTNRKLFETPLLADGPHSIKVVVKGTKNLSSTGNQVIVDGFEFYHNDIPLTGSKSTFIKSPATRWQDNLVGANGLLGVMDNCDPLNDILIFNHGKLAEPDAGPQPVPDISNVIEQCKDDNLAGNYLAAANRSYNEAVTKGCKGYNTQAHHPAYFMKISLSSACTISNYKALVNYETGEITTTWKDNNGNWERKTFVSKADNVVVTYITKPSGGSAINCSLELNQNLPKLPSAMTFDNIITTEFLNLRAKYNVPGQNAGYEGVTKVLTDAGTRVVNGNILTISNANSVLLITKLERYKDDYTLWNNKNLQTQLNYINTDYNILLSRHIAVYTPTFNRISIDLGGNIADRMLSSEELMTVEESNTTVINSALLERMFYSGLYLYITNSGHGSPRLSTINLGAWGAAWSGDWTTDANTNLQVSAGNILNQPESMEAYFNLLEKQFKDWRVNAHNLLGCRGIMAPVRTDGEDGLHTHFFNGWPINFWTSGADWLLLPFCEYYEATGDDVFLKNRLFPWLKELGHFYVDFLNRTDKNGNKVFAVSWSPENTPLNSNTQACINATMDIAAAKHALSKLIKYANQLKLAGDSIPVWTKLLSELPPYLVANDGALKEWAWPSLDNNYNHRHISHLYPVFGTQEISKFETPQLFDAAKVALDLSGPEDGSAFGYCQRILSENKLYRGEKAYNYLKVLLKNHFIYNKSLMTSHYNTSANNIYCSDMACGFPTMVTEMLINTKPGWIELLPALAAPFTKGSITGIQGRNQVLVNSLHWNFTSRSVGCNLISSIDQNINLHVPRGIKTITSNATIELSNLGNDVRVLKLKAGEPVIVNICLVASSAPVFPDPYEYYKIVNRNSEKLLEVSGVSKEEGAVVDQYRDVEGAQNEHWQLVDVGGGYYNIVNRYTGKALEKNGSNGNIDQYSIWNGAKNEHWQIIDLGNGYYKIKLRSTGKILEVNGASKEDGATMADVDDHNGTNAQWKFVPTSVPTGQNSIIEEFDFGFFPNPVSGDFIIKLSGNKDTLVQIFDIHGLLKYQTQTNSSNLTLNSKQLKLSGLNLIKSSNEQGVKTKINCLLIN